MISSISRLLVGMMVMGLLGCTLGPCPQAEFLRKNPGADSSRFQFPGV